MANDVLLPPWLKIARLRTDYADNTGMARGLYTKAPETTGFGGDRLRLSLEFTPTSSRQSAVERATIRAFLASLRGRQKRAYLWDPSYKRRGSFPAGELLANGTFADGATTGFTSSSSYTRTANDRTYRATVNQPPATTANLILAVDNALTQYAPYIGRIFVSGRRLARVLTAVMRTTGGAGVKTGTALTTSNGDVGMVWVTYTGAETSLRPALTDNAATGTVAGDYADIPYISLSRCALVDNGPNLLLQSDELDTSWTPTRCSVDDQTAGTTAPDGTSTADSIIEDGSTNTHFLTQTAIVSSAAVDFCYGVALKAGTRAWARLSVTEATGSTVLASYFNLSTGVAGTSTAGANWANVRTFVVPLGDGWFACYVVGRKTNAATSLNFNITMASADNTNSYAGDGASNIYAWRATPAQSSVPTRLALTTTTALPTGVAQSGSTLHIKGLPASTQGLLLPDDRFEVITDRGSELKIVTASLDSGAGGLGYLQFEPPLMGVPADNAPIIIHEPMTRAIFAGDMVGWDDSPGILTTASAEFEEAA